MMYQTGTYKLAFIKEPQMQVLELPYVNNKLSMIILLPVGTASLEQVKNANVQRTHVCLNRPAIYVYPVTLVCSVPNSATLWVRWDCPRGCEREGDPGPCLQDSVFWGNNLFLYPRGHKEAKVPSCTSTTPTGYLTLGKHHSVVMKL